MGSRVLINKRRVSPRAHLEEIFHNLRSSRSLGWRLFSKDIKAEYRQSYIGIFWAIVPPIITTVLWVFLNKSSLVNVSDTGVPYPAFVLTSTLLWTIFAKSLNMPMGEMRKYLPLLSKINFPDESIIIAGTLKVYFAVMIRLGLFLLALLIFPIELSWTLLLVPIGLVTLTLLGATIGLFLTPIGMLYTDIGRIIQLMIPFWMLATPVVYPEPKEGLATIVNEYNPVTPVLSITRDLLIYGDASRIGELLMIFLTVLFLFLVLYIVLKSSIPFLIERN